jgi:hypothetical protein
MYLFIIALMKELRSDAAGARKHMKKKQHFYNLQADSC